MSQATLTTSHWANYYQAVEGRPPRETLMKALDRFDTELLGQDAADSRWAVDLGCGNGRETVELLRRGWRVLAIDGESQALDRLLRLPNLPWNHLQIQQMRFEALVLPSEIDLINASFCLNFCLPGHFADLWQTIVTALKPGGRFCGHLLGDRDSGMHYPDRTHHTQAQVLELLEPFEVEWFLEEEHPGVTPIGEEKYWHIFHIVARKA